MSCHAPEAPTRRRTGLSAVCLSLLCARIAASDAPPTNEELLRLIQEQRLLIEEQGRQIAEQGLEIAELRRRLEPTPAAPGVSEPRPPAAETAAAGAVAATLPHAATDDVDRLPEAEGKKVEVDAFPGSLSVPGTSARIRLGGWVRSVAADRFDPMGSDDGFTPSSIAVGPPNEDQDTGSTFSAKPTRLNLDLRTPTGVGAMRAYVEIDFEGTDASVRLRHAYGRWGWLLFGQTWTTFGDPKAEPDSINIEGFSATTDLRQPVARVTAPLGKRTSLAFALETADSAVSGAPGEKRLPDAILRFRVDQTENPQGTHTLFPSGGGHFQAALALRQLAATAPDGSTLTTAGYGLGVTTRLAVPGIGRRDWLLAGVTLGKGMGRYVRDLDQAGGQDAVFDPVSGSFEPLPEVSGYAALEHWWATTLRTTLAAGIVRVFNLDSQPADALHGTDQFSFNLTWSPIRRVDLVTELQLGRRINKDNQHGRATQLQIGSTFRF